MIVRDVLELAFAGLVGLAVVAWVLLMAWLLLVEVLERFGWISPETRRRMEEERRWGYLDERDRH